MKYAENIKDISNAFRLGPLDEKDMEEFYYPSTMEFRTGDKYSSPIRVIFEACQMPSEKNVFLLLGHKGCGKSTELNKMSAELRERGYYVYNVKCSRDLDLNNPLYTDLLILMGEALLQIAKDASCNISQELQDKITKYWISEIESDETVAELSSASLEAGAQIKSPGFFSMILSFFANVKADIRYNQEKRIRYKEKISLRSREWLLMLRQIADEITLKLNYKQPILIFEDLDKIDPSNARTVFIDYAATLTGVSFPVIYTFPIAVAYDPDFHALEGYFNPQILPMIKLKTPDGKVFQEGFDAIMAIINKRVKLSLFTEGSLETAVEKTGGALRDLFYIINTAAQRAIHRDSGQISDEDIRIALNEMKSSLTRRIERIHYEFLADIYRGNKETIEDKKLLLEMLLANAVLEYNGSRWHDVHPLVAEFLIDQKLV